MDRQQIENQLANLKQSIMDILSQVTVLEYQIQNLSIKQQESPPRKKSSRMMDADGASVSSTSFRMPQTRDRKIKKRIQPVPTHNTDNNIQKDEEDINWDKEQEKWFMRRNNRQNESLDALAQGNRIYHDENTMVEPLPGEQEELPDHDYTIGYSYKAKSHTRETITQWVDRLVSAVLIENINPFLTLKALEEFFAKLKKKFKQLNVPNTLMLRLALNNFAELKKLFVQLKQFLEVNEKKAAVPLKT